MPPRIARPNDADAITVVLASAFPQSQAAPSMARANPALLASGTYFVHTTPTGQIVACGGWTPHPPGQAEPGIGHIRHFATHPAWLRQGLAAAIYQACRQQALTAGIHTFHCLSSPQAEPFYASQGFRTVERTETRIGTQSIPTLTMIRPNLPFP